jgi:hypothetical protein
MNFWRILSVSILTLTFISCGGPVSDDSTKAKSDRDNAKLTSQFATVVGVYSGKVTLDADGRELGGKVILYVDYQSDGTDNNHASIGHPVLKSQFKLDGVGELDDATFRVDFDPGNGYVHMTQQATSSAASTGATGGAAANAAAGTAAKGATCPVGPPNVDLAISGNIVGGQMNAELQLGSRIGVIAMNKISSDSSQPVRDQSDRLLKAYQKIIGTYDGAVLKDGTPVAANIVFRIEEVSLAEGLTCPTLKAQFKFKRDFGFMNDTKFNVSFRESSGHVLLEAQESGNSYTCSFGLPDLSARIEGSLVNGKLSGQMNGAVVGKVSASRSSPSTEIINDQDARLRAAYAPVEGVYAGRFASSSGSSMDKFPVRFSLWVDVDYQDADKKLKCPILKGLYSRPDMTSETGAIQLRAEYRQSSSLLTVVNQPSSPGECKQAGCKDLTIDDAIWNSTGFTGTMHWFRTPPGTVNVKRCPNGWGVDRQGKCAANAQP